jgi:hypothetical protein
MSNMKFEPGFANVSVDLETFPHKSGRFMFTKNGEMFVDTESGRTVYQEFVPKANEAALLAIPNKRENQLFMAINTNTLYRWDISTSELVKIVGADVESIKDRDIKALLREIGFLAKK